MPHPVVHRGRSRLQQHEDQVAQQVRLGEVDAGRVQRLEDAVRVVPRACRDIDNREPLHHDPGQAVHVERLRIGPRQLHLAAEEPVRLADRVLAAGIGAARDTGEERRAVRLGRQQPETRVAVLELVDQVQLVVPLDRQRVRRRRGATNRAQHQHQRRQPLLPVHDQVGRDVACRRRNRRQDDAAEEMARLACPGAASGARVLLQDVPPQQPVLVDPPGVLALPQKQDAGRMGFWARRGQLAALSGRMSSSAVPSRSFSASRS